ncbi:MAG: hypothetical protein IAE87_07875 [Rhodobacteraceae bacterium]|jgi:hypothetical protein|nr:hypothetical protein [Paracoccaceae bacterium]
MAVSPADPVARAFGGRVVRSATAPGPASHDGAGGRYVFLPAAGDTAAYALDVERRAQDLPAAVAAALGRSGDAAAQGWTALEVVAKLTGTPVLALLRMPYPAEFIDRPEQFGIEIERTDTEDLWIAVGRHP